MITHKICEIEKEDIGSITPTTVRKTKELITMKAFEEVPLCFKFFYEYINDKGEVNEVLRFGLNPKAIKADFDKKEILSEPVYIMAYSDKPVSVSSSRYGREEASKIKLHSLEKELLKEAIAYLSKSESNTVVVDIFARANGVIKAQASGDVEVHSVVLYKALTNEEGRVQIVVIDPSNFLFSSHLSNINDELDISAEIITLHKALQIYKAEGKVGPEFDEYRDCIDIAVKLAFGLNNTKPDIDVNILKNDKGNPQNIIKTLDIIKMISNQDSIDIAFPKIKHPVRIKQTSDLNETAKFFEAERTVKLTLDKIEKLSNEKFTICLKEYNALLCHKTLALPDFAMLNHDLVEVYKNLAAEQLHKLEEAHEALIKLIGDA
ncbi:MAG: hypothetical protein K0R02_610 [Rickettsiaceae bacterium]|jgi:hypothetical protein|nr:hypothetical protein [Rickettsiaceae bacterium]